MNFWEGPAAGADLPEPSKPEGSDRNLGRGLKPPWHALYPCGVGADLKASPLPLAPLAVAGFMVAGLAVWQYSDRLAGLLGFAARFSFC